MASDLSFDFEAIFATFRSRDSSISYEEFYDKLVEHVSYKNGLRCNMMIHHSLHLLPNVNPIFLVGQNLQHQTVSIKPSQMAISITKPPTLFHLLLHRVQPDSLDIPIHTRVAVNSALYKGIQHVSVHYYVSNGHIHHRSKLPSHGILCLKPIT